MTAFWGEDPRTVPDIDPADMYFQNLTTVKGLIHAKHEKENPGQQPAVISTFDTAAHVGLM